MIPKPSTSINWNSSTTPRAVKVSLKKSKFKSTEFQETKEYEKIIRISDGKVSRPSQSVEKVKEEAAIFLTEHKKHLL